MLSPVLEAYFSSNAVRHHTHYHDCHQLLFIVKGSAEIRINNTVSVADAGHLAVFSRFETHAVHVLTPEYERFVLRINPAAGNGNRLYSLLFNRPDGFCNVIDTKEEAPVFHQLFADLVAEQHAYRRLTADLQQALVHTLLIRLYRCMPLSFLAEDRFDVVFSLQQRFENDLHSTYVLADLAREYGMSASSLSHRFKEITGTSVMGYLQSCRLAAAKALLAQSTLGIGEIVERCGFSDNSNFSRTFKQLVGVSPSQFRKRYSRIHSSAYTDTKEESVWQQKFT